MIILECADLSALWFSGGLSPILAEREPQKKLRQVAENGSADRSALSIKNLTFHP